MVRNVHINAGNGGSGYDVKIGSGLLGEVGALIKNVLNGDKTAIFTG